MSMSSVKNWFFSLKLWKKGVLLLLAIAAIFFLTAPARAKKPALETAVATRKTIVDTVNESGNISPAGEVDVPSTTTGVIQKLFVQNGDVVKSGQKLFDVKATATPQEKATAYTTYLAAKSTLAADTATLFSLQSTMYTSWKKYTDLSTNSTYQNSDSTPNTTNRVLTDFTTAQDNWLAAEANYKNQQSVLAKDKSSLNTAYLGYQSTQNVTVVAPVDGIVENVSYAIGDKVVVNTTGLTTTSSSSPVLYILTSDASTFLVKVQVNEVDYPKLHLGQKASLTFPAVPNKTFSGTVSKIDALGTNTSGVITFNVYVTVESPSPQLAANMTSNVMIETARHNHALTVPNSAIKPYKGGKAVQIFDAKNPSAKLPQLTPVSIGIKSIDTTEVLSGISEGTIVVTSVPQKPVSGFGGGG